MLLTVAAFVFVFTVITLAHEGGHLFFSKRVGIRVHEFGLGFGPTLFSVKKNHTTYKINLLPILGYVKIAGIDVEDPQEKDTPDDEKYFNKGVGAKFVSIVAGALMNIVLGFLVFSIIFMISGAPKGITNEIATISPGSEAAHIDLRTGDKLTSINQKKLSPEAAIEIIHQSAGTELKLGILRDGKPMVVKATPQAHKRMKIGLIGFSLKSEYERVGIFKAIYYGAAQTFGLTITILLIVGKLFSGQISLLDLAGPVGIANITGQYAQNGFVSLLSFLAFFSINVAVLNLLPLPALDGGRLFFILIELVRRKPISIEKENLVHAWGLYAFLALFAVLTVNDILRMLR
ncbi:MAG: RIP metalloprotease RseP [bacterium]